MKIYYQLLLITLILLQIQTRPLSPKRVKWAVNCGSNQSRRSYRSFMYQEDKNYDTSIETMTLDYSKKDEYKDQMIYYSFDEKIHQTMRYSHDKIRYFIPLKQFDQGKYVIMLRFVEMEFGKKGKRQFDIKFGDQTVLENLDVASKNRGGKFYAYDEYLEIVYRDNHIVYKKPKSSDKYIIDLNDDGTLTLELSKKIDYPMINAIILYEGGIADTNFHEFEMEQEQWVQKNKDKLRKEYEKQKEEKKQKEIEQQKEYELKKNKHKHTEQKQEVPPLKDLLMTPFGIVAMIGFFVSSFVMIYFTFFDPYGIEKEKRERQNLPTQNRKVQQEYEKIDSQENDQVIQRNQ